MVLGPPGDGPVVKLACQKGEDFGDAVRTGSILLEPVGPPGRPPPDGGPHYSLKHVQVYRAIHTPLKPVDGENLAGQNPHPRHHLGPVGFLRVTTSLRSLDPTITSFFLLGARCISNHFSSNHRMRSNSSSDKLSQKLQAASLLSMLAGVRTWAR